MVPGARARQIRAGRARPRSVARGAMVRGFISTLTARRRTITDAAPGARRGLAGAVGFFCLAASLVVPPPASAATKYCANVTPVSQRPTLYHGDDGWCVQELQARLNRNGYPVSQPHTFGPVTLGYVKQFQATKGAVRDRNCRCAHMDGADRRHPGGPALHASHPVHRAAWTQPHRPGGAVVRRLSKVVHSVRSTGRRGGGVAGDGRARSDRRLPARLDVQRHLRAVQPEGSRSARRTAARSLRPGCQISCPARVV